MEGIPRRQSSGQYMICLLGDGGGVLLEHVSRSLIVSCLPTGQPVMAVHPLANRYLYVAALRNHCRLLTNYSPGRKEIGQQLTRPKGPGIQHRLHAAITQVVR